MPQLSDLASRAAKPAAAAFTIWDDATAGFGLRVYPGGAKSFIVLIGSGRRQTIGKCGPGGLTLSEARTEAGRILAQKILGKVRPKHIAFEDARNTFLTQRGRTRRPRTLADYRRLLVKHYPYGRSSVASITPQEICARLRKLPQAERHDAFSAGRAFFRFCGAQHYIERSPIGQHGAASGFEASAARLEPERACRRLPRCHGRYDDFPPDNRPLPPNRPA